MKRLFYVFIVMNCMHQGTFAASHSFFSPRQITTDASFELALTDYDIYRADTTNFLLHVKPFFQQSTHDKKLAKFFLPGNKACVSIQENGTGDINPLWFNVISRPGTFYSSQITLRPTSSTFGALFTCYVHMWNEAWLLINTAFVERKNNLQVSESKRDELGTIPGFATMICGLNNPTWCAGKIPCSAKTRAGFDDIQIKLGYDFWFCKQDAHLGPYGVCTIPTGNKPISKFLFEPTVGSRHVTAGFGLNGHYSFWQTDTGQWALLGDGKYRYAFQAGECRSLDLCKNGDWSRYLLGAIDHEQLSHQIPLINVLTLPVKVTPRSTIDLWVAVHYARHNWDVELGYNLWWRQQEKIVLACCKNNLCDGSLGIFDMAGICNLVQTSDSSATIGQSLANLVSDAHFIPITPGDLNLNSAAHPPALSNKLYATSGWHHENNHCALLLAGAVSYEFGNKNALDQWAVWFTIGINV